MSQRVSKLSFIVYYHTESEVKIQLKIPLLYSGGDSKQMGGPGGWLNKRSGERFTKNQLNIS